MSILAWTQPPQNCIVYRRRILEAARRFYEAKFETKLLLYKVRLHHQQLVEKRLRYLNFLQRMRLRHNARIRRRVLRFQRQVKKVKEAYKRKLRSVTKRYQRKVVRKLKTKSLSNRRIRLIKKAFFRRGVISKRAVAKARRLAATPIRVCIPCELARIRQSGIRKIRISKLTSRLPSSHRAIRKVPRKLTLHAKTSVAEKIKRFIYLQRRVDRDVHRTLVFHMRKNKFLSRRRLLQMRIVKFNNRRQLLKRRITALKLKRHELTRSLALKHASGEAAKRVARRIAVCHRRVHDLKKRSHRLQRRIVRTVARRKRLLKRIKVLYQRMERQLQDSKLLFIRAIKYLTRWQATDPKIIGKIGKKNKAKHFKSQSKPVQHHQATVLQTLTPTKIKRIMQTLRRNYRPDSYYFKKTLVYRRRMRRIRRKLARTKRQIANLRKSELTIRAGSRSNVRSTTDIRLLRVRTDNKLKTQKRLERSARVLQSKISRVEVDFARNMQTWTSYLIKVGLSQFVNVLPQAAKAGNKVKQRRFKRKLRQMRIRQRKVLQRKLIKKLTRLGVPPKQVTRIIKQKQIQARRAELKRFAKRAAKRVLRFQRKLERSAKHAEIMAQRRSHIRHRSARLKRRIRRLRVRRNRLKRRIHAIEKRRWRLITQVKRLTAWKLATLKQLNRNPVQVANKVAYVQRKIRRAVHKIAVCKSRVISLRRRRVRMKWRILQITQKRRRLSRRITAVKRRIKKKLNRLKNLVKRKRRFVKRMITKRMVNPRVIQKVSKPSSLVIKRFLSRRIAKKVVGTGLSSQTILHFAGDHRIRKLLSAKTLDNHRSATSHIKFSRRSLPEIKIRDLRLRSKKTVEEHIARFTEWRNRILRDIGKGLSLRLRNNRFAQRRRHAKLRVNRFVARRRALKMRIITIKIKQSKLRRQLRFLQEHQFSNPSRVQLAVSRTQKQLIKCNRKVKVLLKRRESLKRRIVRTTRRRKRIQRRMRLLQKRKQRQLQESRRLLIRAVKNLTRWGATKPEVYQQVLVSNTARLSNLVQSGKAGFLKKPLTKGRVDRIIKKTRNYQRVDTKYFKRILKKWKTLSQVKRKATVLRSKLAKQTKRLVSTQAQIKMKSAVYKKKDVKLVQALETREKVLQTRIAALTKQYDLQAATAAKLKSRISSLHKRFVGNFQTWTWNLMKIGVTKPFQVLRKASKIGIKVRNQSIKRKRQRIADKKLALKQTKLIKKLSVVIGVSKKKLRGLVKLTEGRMYLAQRKRFAKRVVKRVTRIQRKLKRVAKKTAILVRHKQHLKRLRIRLKRRILRMRARRLRLRRRIHRCYHRRILLTRQVRKFTTIKLAIQRQSIGRYTSLHVQNRMRNTFSAADIRIKRNSRKIATLTTRIGRLRHRRVVMKTRISRLIRRRRRYNLRITTVKRRLKQQGERIKTLVKRKRTFVRRVVTQNLVSRRTIRRVSKPSRQLVRRFVSRRVLKKIVPKKAHKSFGWSRKFRIRHIKKHRAQIRGRTAKTIRKAHKLLSKLSQLNSVHLRPKKPVVKKMKRFTGIRSRFVRDLQRTLIFRHRKNSFVRRRKHLRLRIKQLSDRKQVLKRKIIFIKYKRNSLFQRWKVLHQRKMYLRRSGVYNGKYYSSIRYGIRHIEKRITKCGKRIRVLRRRRLRLKRRIERTTVRRRRIRRRISVLRKRMQRQLQDSRRMFLGAIKKFARSGAAYPAAFRKVAKMNKARYALHKLHHRQQQTSILKSITRPQIKRIVDFVQNCHRDDAKDFQNLLENQRRIVQKRSRISKTKREIVALRRKLLLVQKRLEYKNKLKIKDAHEISELEASEKSLLLLIQERTQIETSETLELQKLEAAVSYHINSYISHLHKWTWYLIEIGLPEYSEVVSDGARAVAKVRRRVALRRLRRIRLQKEIVRQRKRIEKLSLTIRKSERKLQHIIKRKIVRKQRTLLKRFAQRVVKRVTRIQRKLKRAAKNAAIVARHKQHLKRLQVRLKHRLSRLRERRHRLKRRIRAVDVQRIRLVSRVRRLSARRVSIQRQLSGRPLSYQTRQSITQLNTQIRYTVNKISRCQSKISVLKRRRVSIKARIVKVLHRQRSLERRVVAVKQRIKRSIQRINRLGKREKRFVSRVVKKKLVSHRVIQPVLKQSLKIILRHVDTRLVGSEVKRKLVKGLQQTQHRVSLHREVRHSSTSSKPILIAGVPIALPLAGIESGFQSRVKLLHRAEKQLQKRKDEVSLLLSVPKLPTRTQDIISRTSPVVPRPDISKVTRALGGTKLLTVTRTELVAKKAVESAKAVSVRSFAKLQSSLRRRLRSLKRRLATASPAFKKLVQRTKSNFESEETQVNNELTEKLAETTETSNEVVYQQKLLYQTEYQTLVQTVEVDEDKGKSAVTSTTIEESPRSKQSSSSSTVIIDESPRSRQSSSSSTVVIDESPRVKHSSSSTVVVEESPRAKQTSSTSDAGWTQWTETSSSSVAV